MSKANMGFLQVQEMSKDKRWTDSKVIARQGQGVFFGGHSDGHKSGSMMKMMKKGKKHG